MEFPDIQRCTLNSPKFIAGSEQHRESRCFTKCSLVLVNKGKIVMMNVQHLEVDVGMCDNRLFKLMNDGMFTVKFVRRSHVAEFMMSPH